LRKPNVERALAGTEVLFGDDAVAVKWHGELGLLVRSPHIYLDWAVNKDRREQALGFLAQVVRFLDEGPTDRYAAVPWSTVEEVQTPTAEVAITYTPTMRLKAAFRPRRHIIHYLHPTFWALWNELVLRASDEPGAIEPLVDDLRTQIAYYDQHGIGMRGGAAPVYASRVGAGRRLEQEIAEFGGLTVEEFRALSEAERDEIFDRHTRAGIEHVMHLDQEMAEFAGLSVDEFRQLPQAERDEIYRRCAEEWG
jgi:hypothetical protein